jgi:phosphatidylglycerol:prolipoprotein diacylglycerol transferase
MLTYPNIDPVAFSLGPFTVRWYGLSYLVGFAAAFFWCVSKRNTYSPAWTIEQIADLFFYVAVGVIFGGTVGYLLFYHPSLIWENPLALFKFWEPGRSFHGGLIGVVIALLVYARVHKRHFWDIGDFICPAIPLGLAAGRIGNFLNGELWGRVTTVPWGMVFPFAGPEPRHPSQLYEFLLEGVLLFVVLAFVSRKPRARGVISGLFLLGYGLCRGFVEFFREPDVTHGFILGDWLTMGQLLSIPMIVIGLFLILFAKEKNVANKKVR